MPMAILGEERREVLLASNRPNASVRGDMDADGRAMRLLLLLLLLFCEWARERIPHTHLSRSERDVVVLLIVFNHSRTNRNGRE